MNISYILDNQDQYRDVLTKRFMDSQKIDQIVNLHKEYCKKINSEKEKREIKNSVNKIIKNKPSEKDLSNVKDLITDLSKENLFKLSKDLTEKIKLEEDEKNILLEQRDKLVSELPNILHESVPIDKNEDNNQIICINGKIENSDHGDHAFIVEKFDLVRLANNISGHRAYVLCNDVVRLNYALMNYSLDFMKKKGFDLMYTPHFVSTDIMGKVCQLSDFEESLYELKDENKYLIATSEQFLTAFNSNKVFNKLPVKQCGISTCFRKEAGSHGKDVNGIFRVHQFEKVEQFVITEQSKSYEMMEEMLGNAKEFYDSLGLSYRVVNIVSGALNNAAAKKYDLEGWFPGSKRFRELVSCSNTLDYFSRKLNIKDKHQNNVHMLNSTLYANTRTLSLILETYFDGTKILIPDVLVPYFGTNEINQNQS
jgi:seryl-tRNA synthetase